MRLKGSTSLAAFQPPVMFDFSFEQNPTKTFAAQANEANIHVKAVVNPQLITLLTRSGFVRRGSKRHIYAMSLNDGGDIALRRFIKNYTETFQPRTLLGSPSQLADLGYYQYRGYMPQPAIDVFSRQFPQLALFPDNYNMTQQQIRIVNESRLRTVPTPFLVLIESKARQEMVWVRIIRNTSMLHDEAWPMIDGEEIAGDTIKYKGAFSFFEYDSFKSAFQQADIRKEQVTPESETFFNLASEVENRVLISYKAGHPAVGVIRVGDNVRTGRGFIPARYNKAPNSTKEIKVRDAISLSKKHTKVDFLFHPALKDIASMTTAKPFKDSKLREYQRTAVGLHISTKVGYLNACSPGLGKTVMQLSGMRERAEAIPNYKGLILAEMNVLQQWSEEMEKWFPTAVKVITDNNHNLAEVAAVLANPAPAVVLMPYAHLNHVWKEMERVESVEEKLSNLRTFKQKASFIKKLKNETTLGTLILNTKWDDVAADEAMVIRNNSSKQAKAAWRVRENSEVAVALTGTPINNAVSDIANLIAWTRNDRKLFRGVNFEADYDLAKPAQAKKLFETFGPLVFRRDTTELKDELPKTNSPKIHLLEATSGERALISTAENELRRCYEELLQALNNVEANSENEAELESLKEELRDARKAWLGGQTLARMATSDPQAVGNSESVGAALLIGQGLVDAALQKVPTKRKTLVKEIGKRVAAQQQTLVFVEFEATAQIVKETLRENGIKAETFTGKNRRTRDEHRIAFQNGELDVLVITQAGERGLTLHRASAVYCYDLPWSLEKVLQRIGRAVRIGSQNKIVDIVFMVMKDTIEEKIANKLVNMAVSSVNLLDTTRGVKAKDTEVMTSLGGLVKSVSQSNSNAALKAFGQQFL